MSLFDDLHIAQKLFLQEVERLLSENRIEELKKEVVDAEERMHKLEKKLREILEQD
jgi:hypothetical protein